MSGGGGVDPPIRTLKYLAYSVALRMAGIAKTPGPGTCTVSCQILREEFFGMEEKKKRAMPEQVAAQSENEGNEDGKKKNAEPQKQGLTAVAQDKEDNNVKPAGGFGKQRASNDGVPGFKFEKLRPKVRLVLNQARS